jgi:hypothetical protein
VYHASDNRFVISKTFVFLAATKRKKKICMNAVCVHLILMDGCKAGSSSRSLDVAQKDFSWAKCMILSDRNGKGRKGVLLVKLALPKELCEYCEQLYASCHIVRIVFDHIWQEGGDEDGERRSGPRKPCIKLRGVPSPIFFYPLLSSLPFLFLEQTASTTTFNHHNIMASLKSPGLFARMKLASPKQSVSKDSVCWLYCSR